jgi:glycosyltransferase involved in cell wall biosynthesis
MNETSPTITFNGCVDIAIPVFGEPGAALEATLDACLRQDQPASQIFVVDDGSPVPVSIPERIMASGKVQLWRMPENSGIAAARNFAIAHSTAAWVACINCEVLPAPDWLQKCSQPSLRTPARRGMLHADGSPESPSGCCPAGGCAFRKPSSATHGARSLLPATRCCFAGKR